MRYRPFPILKKTAILISISFFSLSVYANEKKALNLNSDSIDETLVITATATSKSSIQDAPANVEVVSRDEIVARNAVDLLDALRGVSGLQFTSVGMNRRAISIHGMSTSYTLILIDGRRINNTDSIAHSNFDIDSIPIDSVERIEVIKGPMSALYGSEALGGVINIITRENKESPSGNISLQGGLSDGVSTTRNYKLGGHFSSAIIPDTLYLTANIDRYYRANIQNEKNHKLSDFQGIHSDSGDVNLSWKINDQQTLDTYYSDSIDKLWRDTVRGASTYYCANERIHRKGYGLSHTGEWDWAQSKINLYRNTLSHDLRYTNNVAVTSPHQHIADTIFDTRFAVPLFERHLLTIGNEWRKEELESDGFAKGERSVIKNAIFIQDQIDLTADYRWSLLLGNRFDYQNSYGWNNSPRAYLVHKVNDQWTIKGGIGRGFKSPTLKQSSSDYTSTGGGGRFTIQGNPNLNPEQSTTYELNTHYQGDSWNFTAGVFQNNVRNLIQTTCIANCGISGSEIRTYQNVDKARIQGIETGFDIDLPYNFNWGINYSYTNAKDQKTKKSLPNRSAHIANMKLQWNYSDDVSLFLRGEYVGSQIMESSNVRYHVPTYTLWHLGLNANITKNIALQANLNNLTNEHLADKSSRYNYEELGRTLIVGLNINF